MTALPFEILPAALASCGALFWRYRGRLQLTVIVKSTFCIVPGGAMIPAEPEELYPDIHYDNDPRRSLLAASDLAPYKPKADVVVTGWVYAPPESRAAGLSVRLAVIRRKPLLEKTIQIVGDFAAGAGMTLPFSEMPLVYERSFGGPTWGDNPAGTGMLAGSAPPNLVDPLHAQRTIGLGPISPAWPARASLLGSLDPAALTEPVAEIPDDFNWDYFQAAPPDQRIEYLRGDEQIGLENFYATHPALQTTLPGVKAVGKIYGLPGHEGGRALNLHIDTLHIDTERGRCSITWRANLPLDDDIDRAALQLEASVESNGKPITLPKQDTKAIVAPAAPGRILEGSEGETVPFAARRAAPIEHTLEIVLSKVTRGPLLPFQPAIPGAAPPDVVPPSLAELSAAAASPIPIRESSREVGLESTLNIADVAEPGPALPFVSPEGAAKPPPVTATLRVPIEAAAPVSPDDVTRRIEVPRDLFREDTPQESPPNIPMGFVDRLAKEGIAFKEAAAPAIHEVPATPAEAPPGGPNDAPGDAGDADEGDEPDALDTPARYSTPESRAAARTLGALMVAEDDELDRFRARNVSKDSSLERDDLARIRDILRALDHALKHGGDQTQSRLRDVWSLIFQEPRAQRKRRRLAKKGTKK